MYHDFHVCFDHYTIRKHFQEFVMLGSVTKKLSLKNYIYIYTVHLNFYFFLKYFFSVYKDNTTCCREVKQYGIG